MSGILESLVKAPFHALGLGWKGWKVTGQLTSKKGLKEFRQEVAHDLSTIGDTVSDGVGRVWNKGSSYMHDLSRTAMKHRNPITGSLHVGLKVGLDAANGAVDLAAAGVGKAISYGVGLPLAGVAATSRLGVRMLGFAGKELGGYKALKWAGKKTGQGAWWMTKTGAKGLALEGTKVVAGAAVAGKVIWKMRNNKTFQRGAFATLFGGSLLYGGVEGDHAARAGRLLPYDEFQSTFTGPQPIHNPEFANVPGARMSRKIDDFGASGELVLAMNNLRNKGMF